jgi:hypothetical protein
VSSPQPSYSAGTHLDAAAYGTGYAAGQQAVAAANWYGTTDGNQAIDGYLDRGNGAPGTGYSDPGGYSSADYGAGDQAPVDQGGQPTPAGGYGQPGPAAGQYDYNGYRHDAGYGQDGRDAYPGYGGAAR